MPNTFSDLIKKKEEQEVSESKNRGQLILDATCTPSDISYPTDSRLLNQAYYRQKKL